MCIAAADELDDIWRQIRATLKASPVEFAEEFAIHDHEGLSQQLSRIDLSTGSRKSPIFVQPADRLVAKLSQKVYNPYVIRANARLNDYYWAAALDYLQAPLKGIELIPLHIKLNDRNNSISWHRNIDRRAGGDFTIRLNA